MRKLVFLCGCLAMLLAADVAAQQTPARSFPQALSSTARARVAAADTVLHARTRPVPGGRVDVTSGVTRAAYHLRMSAPASASPEAAARTFFQEMAPRFGWQPEAPDLALERVQRRPRSTHLTYRQTVRGSPVYGRYVKVNLNDAGQPTMALSTYAPHLKGAGDLVTQPSLSAAEARTRAAEAVSTVGATTSEPTLVVFPSDPPRLAWRLLAWPDDAPAEWDVLIDARSGDVLYLVDQATHAHEHGEEGREKRKEHEKTLDLKPATSNQQPITRNPQPVAQIDGSGLVFDPDPLSSAGVPYGAPYVDANDADVPELNAERVEVTLHDITQGDDGLYRLVGPYVAVDGTVGQERYDPPAETDPDAFRYPRSDQHFEAVMVYYHIDKSQRYLQSLGLEWGLQDEPIRVNPHGLGTADNSNYQPSLNVLQFGDGGIDDAEDADVIWHEYGHALLEAGAPGLLCPGVCEGRSLHEGWSDYWAASYSRYLEEEGLVPPGDWRKMFSWDGNETWSGRRLDNDAHYPDGLVQNIYTDGLLWATTLMQVYDDLGRTVTDRLNLLSHAYLNPGLTLRDAAEAIIQADIDYYDGLHLSVLMEHFGNRGLVDPGSYGPVLTHDPLGYHPETGPTVTFEVTATPILASIASVEVIYQVDGEPAQTLALTNTGEDRYSGTVTLPGTASEVTYYVEATDTDGLRSVLPTGAPDETYTFGVGPDTEPPQITHTSISTASLQAWPPEIVATVEDNLEVGTVSVAFTVEDDEGQAVEDGSFALAAEDDVYAGTFPIPIDKVAAGSTVRYRITAGDGASPPNETTLPAQGTFSFPVVAEGTLVSFDFEVAQGEATGAWTHGTPTFFLQTAHAGSGVWSTGLARSYPHTAQQATLELPSLNLSGLSEAYLVFWHWYDVENSGDPADLVLWDGANVKVSTDGGASWSVEEPIGGYTASISDRFGNPMGGEPAWGGYSHGWQRAVVPLPAEADVRVRFDFGTDTSNLDESLAYAGWHLDDVAITTVLPADATAPTVTHAPPAEMVRAPGAARPEVRVRATDGTGVTDVTVQYQTRGGASGTVRLPMHLTATDTFTGVLPVPAGDVGDYVDYRFTVRDPDGNTATYPAGGDPPLRIAYEDVDRMAVLAGASASGAWATTGNGGWHAAPQRSDDVSTLMLDAVNLPTDPKTILFSLDHSYYLGPGLGGNVKLSVDGGAWRTLEPLASYTLDFGIESNHPMADEPVFAGEVDPAVQSLFDLSAYAGRQVRLRLDLGARRAAADESWSVDDAMLLFLDIDTAVETERPLPDELALHPNYPNPFADRTTIRYTLPAPADVRLDVFNLLGRRVTTLVEAPQSAGAHTVTLSADGLASGLYLVRLHAGEAQRTMRVVVAR